MKKCRKSMETIYSCILLCYTKSPGLGRWKGKLKYKSCLFRGIYKKHLFPFYKFSIREGFYLHSHWENFSIICSKPPFLANPEKRTWLRIVYLGRDTSRHREKEGRVRQEGEKSIKFALLHWFALWATRALFH